MEKYGYRFSFGPWNIHEGADPFGPAVRPPWPFADKLREYKLLGFDAVQFHDDDAVPDLDGLSPAQIGQAAQAMRRQIEDEGLVANAALMPWIAPKKRPILAGSWAQTSWCCGWPVKEPIFVKPKMRSELPINSWKPLTPYLIMTLSYV